MQVTPSLSARLLDQQLVATRPRRPARKMPSGSIGQPSSTSEDADQAIDLVVVRLRSL